MGDQTVGQALLLGNIVQIRRMPDLAGLSDQRFDQMRVIVAERQHGDAGAEIEELSAVIGIQIGSIALLESDISTSIGRHNRLAHRCSPDIRSPNLFGPSPGRKKRRSMLRSTRAVNRRIYGHFTGHNTP